MSCIYNFSMNSKRDSATTQTAKKIATQCVGARVRMLNRLVTRIYDDSLREHGIKFSQMNILTLIALHHSIQPSEVGRVLALEKSTLSRNFRLMEENGWIEAIPGETGNSLLLQLTPIGQRLYKKAAPAWDHAQDQVVELLGKSTAKAIRTRVDQVIGPP